MVVAPRINPAIKRKSDRTKPPANGNCRPPKGGGTGGGTGADSNETNGGAGGGDSVPNSNTNFVATNKEGKAEAEKFLGRSLSDEEYSELLAATVAEAGSDQRERAYVAGTILNRARTTGLTVGEVLRQPSQFQAVTGTKYDRSPSSAFVNGPSPAQETLLNGSFTNYLSEVPKNNYYFDAANPKAYGPGTTMPKTRDGVPPTTIGASRFYPGAKWP